MKSDYTKLSRITFIRGLGITLGAVASVFLLRALTRGHLADTIVRWIAQGFSMSETQADIVYTWYCNHSICVFTVPHAAAFL